MGKARLLADMLEQEVRKRHGVVDACSERRAALFADQGIRVLSVGKKEKRRLAPIPKLRQNRLESPPGCGTPRSLNLAFCPPFEGSLRPESVA